MSISQLGQTVWSFINQLLVDPGDHALRLMLADALEDLMYEGIHVKEKDVTPLRSETGIWHLEQRDEYGNDLLKSILHWTAVPQNSPQLAVARTSNYGECSCSICAVYDNLIATESSNWKWMCDPCYANRLTELRWQSEHPRDATGRFTKRVAS